MTFSGYTLILPSVAVGNVAQLSVDLIISTLGLRRTGRFFDTAFIPLVGADPYNENSQDICTALDIFVSDEKKIVVLQIRSLLTKRPVKFFTDLLNFITDNKIAKVVVLTSSFGHEKRDEQLRTVPFRYLASQNLLSKHKKTFENLSWMTLEPKPIDEFSDQDSLDIHGGGFANKLFELFQQNNIQCLILIKFCSEGDNIPDAVDLINYLNKWLHLILVEDNKPCKLKFPFSWKFLYGNSPPREIGY